MQSSANESKKNESPSFSCYDDELYYTDSLVLFPANRLYFTAVEENVFPWGWDKIWAETIR